MFLHVDWSFRAPVRPGDEITAEAEVIEVRDDKPISTLRTTITNQDGTVVLEDGARLPGPSVRGHLTGAQRGRTEAPVDTSLTMPGEHGCVGEVHLVLGVDADRRSARPVLKDADRRGDDLVGHRASCDGDVGVGQRGAVELGGRDRRIVPYERFGVGAVALKDGSSTLTGRPRIIDRSSACAPTKSQACAARCASIGAMIAAAASAPPGMIPTAGGSHAMTGPAAPGCRLASSSAMTAPGAHADNDRCSPAELTNECRSVVGVLAPHLHPGRRRPGASSPRRSYVTTE